MKKLFLLLSLFSMALTSCEKTENEDETYDCPDFEGGDFEHEISGCWQIVDWYSETPIVYSEGEEPTTDLYSKWDGCFKESILVLSDNHSSKMIYMGPRFNKSCISYIPGQVFWHDPWTIGFNETDEFLVFFQSEDEYISSKIIELTDTRLVINNPFVITDRSSGLLVFERP